jgi:hypothetical protein
VTIIVASASSASKPASAAARLRSSSSGTRDDRGDTEIEFVGLEGADGPFRREVADPQRADLDDVARFQRAFGRARAVDEQPVPAAKVADEHVFPLGRKFCMPSRQQGVVVTEIAHRIPTHDKPFDEQQLTFALPVVHDQHFAHRLRVILLVVRAQH